jgi:hypothetical protein
VVENWRHREQTYSPREDNPFRPFENAAIVTRGIKNVATGSVMRLQKAHQPRLVSAFWAVNHRSVRLLPLKFQIRRIYLPSTSEFFEYSILLGKCHQLPDQAHEVAQPTLHLRGSNPLIQNLTSRNYNLWLPNSKTYIS